MSKLKLCRVHVQAETVQDNNNTSNNLGHMKPKVLKETVSILIIMYSTELVPKACEPRNGHDNFTYVLTFLGLYIQVENIR